MKIFFEEIFNFALNIKMVSYKGHLLTLGQTGQYYSEIIVICKAICPK